MPRLLFPTPLIHVQATLYLCRSCIPERSLSLYTHLPSSFSSNPPALHRSSLLHCRYLSPTSPPPPPPLLTYPPLHLMAPPLCHSLPWLLLAIPQPLTLIFHPPMFFPIHYINAPNTIVVQIKFLIEQLLIIFFPSLHYPFFLYYSSPIHPITHPLAVMSLFNPTICLATLNTFPLPSSASNMSQYLCLSSPWALATTLLDLPLV